MPSNANLSKTEITPRFSRGDIVYVGSSSSFAVQPKNCKKLWVWQSRYDPPYKKTDSGMWYLLKDGPGEDAKEEGWQSGECLSDWFPPKEEESLTDAA